MKRIICMLLALALTLGCIGASAETVKHERVYIVTNAAGEIQSLTDSIRLENADGLQEIADRTLLTGIENVGGSETFAQEGEALTWQAQGNDITYQGTSDKAPAALPVVTLTLDGEAVTAQELAGRAGHASLEVSYQAEAQSPILAVTLLALPEEGVKDLTLENAMLFNEAGRRVLVGWGVPGADAALGLPASFKAEFTADHADLNWMLTLVTAGPVDKVLREADARIGIDPREMLNEITAALTAAMAGQPLPEEGKLGNASKQINTLIAGVNTLNSSADTLASGVQQVSDGAAALNTALAELNGGAAELSTGAQTLAAGVASANDGAAQLNTGLTALTASNDTLNQGAQAILAALLSTAHDQLTAAGLTVPELTAENCAAVLDGLLAQMTPEALQAQAAAQVEEAVRAQVTANEAQIRAAVEEAAQAKVLEAVLNAAQVPMTAEQYAAAAAAGQIPAEQKAAVEAAVQAQMSGEEVSRQIEQAVSQQIEELVRQNVAEHMNDAAVTEKLAQADQARESITALKAQLEQVNAFVQGLAQYTAGVSQAAQGAGTLQQGMTQLNDGAATLSTGAVTLADGMAQAAAGAVTLADGASAAANGASRLHNEGTGALAGTLQVAERLIAAKLLPIVNGRLTAAVSAYESVRAQAGDSYDLRAEGMDGVTAYIIRTDLKR